MPTVETQELPEDQNPTLLEHDESEIPDTAPVKRSVGRPRTRFEPVELPNPRRFPLKAEEFFKYWYDCEQIDPNRLIVYVWRTFPIIDKKALGDPDAVTNIGKMEKAPDPGEWRLEMLKRWGSGNYKLMLKDEGLKKPKAIAQTFVTDLHDPDYPAWIENLDELVMDHPSNQAFIEGLRQKGAFAGESNVATGEAMGIMAGTVKDMAKQLVDSKAKEGKEPAAPQTPAEVAIKTIDMADKAFQSGMNLSEKVTASQVKAAEERAKVAEDKVKAVEAQSSPSAGLGMLREVAELVRSLTPAAVPAAAAAAGTSTEAAGVQKVVDVFMGRITTLESQLMSMQNDRIAGLEKLITAKPAETAAPAPKQDFFADLDKLVAAKDKLQTLFGGGGGEEVEREEKIPMWLQIAQSALAGLPTVATSLLAMSYNMAVAKTGQGAPILPAAPPPADNPNPNNALPGMGGDNPSPTNEAPLGGGAYAMLKQIERPLLTHLNDPNLTGVDFADALMKFHGLIAYEAIRGLGKDTIMALLNSYPPIGSVIQTIPERADEFIDDFLDAGRILAEEREGEGGEGEPLPSQVVGVPPVQALGGRTTRKAAKAT